MRLCGESYLQNYARKTAQRERFNMQQNIQHAAEVGVDWVLGNAGCRDSDCKTSHD